MSAEPKVKSPFPGLRPFNRDESLIFFGRDGLSDTLLEKLHAAHFVAVVGTSGSGKSSLVNAGLLPALRGGFMRGAGSLWRVALFRPGNDPVGNLARALAEEGFSGGAGFEGPEGVERALRRNSLGVVEVVRATRMSPGESLLIVADQFEELYRFKPGPEGGQPRDEAASFVRLLLEAAQQPKPGGWTQAERGARMPIYVILTMRSDYIGESAHFWGLPEAINRGQFLIPRMDDDERREAIEGPVKVFGAKILAPLVNRLLNDAGDDPRQLPILQHTLMRIWDYWEAHYEDESEPLGLEHYKAVGGMARALSLNADQAYEELGEPGEEQSARQRVAEKMFKRLTVRGAGEREGRHSATVGEIKRIAGAEVEEVVGVIDVFRKEGRSFLMPPVAEPLGPDTLIDISHESLISGWDRLKRWAEEEAKSAEEYLRLVGASARYPEREGLLRAPALDVALEWERANNPTAAWAARYSPDFDRAISFLRASEKAREDEAEEERREEEDRRDRQRRELEGAQALASERLLRVKAEQQRTEEQRRRADAEEAARKRESEQAAALLAEQQRVAEAERERAEEQSRYAALQAVSARRLRFAVAALVLVTLMMTGFAVYASIQSGRAAQAKREAEEARGVAEVNAAKAAAATLRAETNALAAEDAKGEAEEKEREALKARNEADQRSKEIAVALSKEKEAVAEKERQRKEATRLKGVADTQAQKAEDEKGRAIQANQKDVKNREALNAFLRGELTVARQTFEELLGSYKDNPEGQAWVHYNFGMILRKRGNYSEAEEQYRQAMTLLNQSLDQQPPGKRSRRGLMAYYHGLAQVEAELGEHDEAESNYGEVLRIAETDPLAEPFSGDDRDIRINILSDLADLYRDKITVSDARVQEVQAEIDKQSERLAVLDRIAPPPPRPTDDPPLGEKSADDRANINAAIKKLKEDREELSKKRNCLLAQARAYRDEVLQEREDRLRPDSLSIAASYAWLAEISPPSGRTQRLVDLSKFIKEANSANRPKDSKVGYVGKLEKLAKQYLSLGKYFQAVWAQEQVVSEKGARGNVTADDLLTLARAYRGAAKLGEAKRPGFLARGANAPPLYESGRDNYEAALKIEEGEKTDTSELRRELASFYMENKKYDEAERLYIDFLSNAPPDSNDAPAVRRLLFSLYRERKSYAEAEKYQAAFLADARARAAAAKQAAGQATTEEEEVERRHERDFALVELSNELRRTADLRAEENKNTEAEELYLEALRVRHGLAGLEGADSLLPGDIAVSLADFYVNRKRDYSGAQAQYEYVIQAWRKAVGPRKLYRYTYDALAGSVYAPVYPADYIESLHGLALIYTRRNDYDDAKLLYREAEEFRDGVIKRGSQLTDPDRFSLAYAKAVGDYAALLRKTGDRGAAEKEATAAQLKKQAESRQERGDSEDVGDDAGVACPEPRPRREPTH